MNKKNFALAITTISIAAFPLTAEYLMKQSVKGIEGALIAPPPSGLYSFESHTFTTCGISGKAGPTLAQCRSAYTTDWDEDSNNFKMDSYQGYQQWKVPSSGTYTIKAIGAAGGKGWNQSISGKGAITQADFELVEGDILVLVVGHQGQNGSNSAYGGGGGGGSWVSKGDNPSTGQLLMVAGGGGGMHSASWGGSVINTYQYGMDGRTDNSGDTVRTWGTYTGDGAAYSNNGSSSSTSYAARSFKNGAVGGRNSGCYSLYGGFGGGGTPHCHNGAGGGGYTGGASGDYADASGEGGGSYILSSAVNASMQVSSAYGHGSITITKK